MNKITYLLCLLFLNCSSQKFSKTYTSFSSTNGKEHIITFLKDSFVEFQNIPTHMSKNISITTKYSKEKGKIIIKIQNLNFYEKKNLKNYGLDYLVDKNIVLTKNNKELIDLKNNTVYVEQKKLSRNFIRRKSIIIINGKKLLSDRGILNGYGLYEKLPRNNEKIRNFIVENANNPKYNYKWIRGLEAYKKFGILGINGVSIYTKIK